MANNKTIPRPTALRRVVALLCALALLLCTLPLSSAAAETAKVVRVGYYENEVFQEGAADGKIRTGYAYEYYRKLSEYTGWKYQYVYGSFSQLYQQLLDGGVDVLAGLARTPERESVLYYPDAPMGSESYSLVKHQSDESVTAAPESLKGKRIGALDSAVSEVLKGYLKEYGVKAELYTFADYQDLFDAFDQNELDLMAAEGDGAYGRDDTEVVSVFGASDYYLCVSRYRTDLIEELNTAQQQLAAEEPNYISGLNAKYYRRSVSSRVFTAAEKKWLSEHRQLTLGYLEHSLPYSDTDKEGQVTGFVAELMDKMLTGMGITDLEVQYVGFESYQDMIDQMALGHIDAAFPVGGGLYYSEENNICQSSPVLTPTMELVYRGDYSEQTTLRFAVNKNNLIQSYYVFTHFPDALISAYDSEEACLNAVRSGEVGCTLLDGLRSHAVLRSSRYAALSTLLLPDRDDRCFGVEIGNAGLLKLLNRGVSVVGQDYAYNLAYSHLDTLYQPNFTDVVVTHWHLFAIVAAVVFAFTLLLRLRRSTDSPIHHSGSEP